MRPSAQARRGGGWLPPSAARTRSWGRTAAPGRKKGRRGAPPSLHAQARHAAPWLWGWGSARVEGTGAEALSGSRRSPWARGAQGGATCAKTRRPWSWLEGAGVAGGRAAGRARVPPRGLGVQGPRRGGSADRRQDRPPWVPPRRASEAWGRPGDAAAVGGPEGHLGHRAPPEAPGVAKWVTGVVARRRRGWAAGRRAPAAGAVPATAPQALGTRGTGFPSRARGSTELGDPGRPPPRGCPHVRPRRPPPPRGRPRRIPASAPGARAAGTGLWPQAEFGGPRGHPLSAQECGRCRGQLATTACAPRPNTPGPLQRPWARPQQFTRPLGHPGQPRPTLGRWDPPFEGRLLPGRGEACQEEARKSHSKGGVRGGAAQLGLRRRRPWCARVRGEGGHERAPQTKRCSRWRRPRPPGRPLAAAARPPPREAPRRQGRGGCGGARAPGPAAARPGGGWGTCVRALGTGPSDLTQARGAGRGCEGLDPGLHGEVPSRP